MTVTAQTLGSLLKPNIKAGWVIYVQCHMLQELQDRGSWNPISVYRDPGGPMAPSLQAPG